MEEVKLQLDKKGHGHFYISDEGEQLAEMVVSVSNSLLTVYHTEVLPKAEGRGLAKQLLAAMVEHARKNGLKVIPLCPYVHAQFKRHAGDYADVWHKSQ
jgi:predicted GNAT family acetyltransferase